MNRLSTTQFDVLAPSNVFSCLETEYFLALFVYGFYTKIMISIYILLAIINNIFLKIKVDLT